MLLNRQPTPNLFTAGDAFSLITYSDFINRRPHDTGRAAAVYMGLGHTSARTHRRTHAHTHVLRFSIGFFHARLVTFLLTPDGRSLLPGLVEASEKGVLRWRNTWHLERACARHR